MMKPDTIRKEAVGATAFTLFELLIVLAVLTLLALMLLPALAGTNVKSHQAQCLNNLKQLTAAWLFYADENNGRLAGNIGGGAASDINNLTKTWCLGWMSLHSPSDNFRLEYLQTSQLGKYLNTNISVFKCPGDQSTFSGKPRVRSVSMNGYLGDPSLGSKTSGYRTYTKLTQIIKPSPAQMFVFIDEREDTINDGHFFVSMTENPNNISIGDFPAAWHNQSGSLSFADGHVEAHKWVDPRTLSPYSGGLSYGVTSPNNPDMAWLMARASSPQ